MTREEFLETVKAAVCKDRQQIYGPPEDSFQMIAEFWATYLHRHVKGPLHPHDVAAMMILLKVARIAKSPHHIDNWLDAAGYAACGGELAPDPELAFVGDFANPVNSSETIKQVIPRASYDYITAAEATGAQVLGKLLWGTTLQNFDTTDKMIIGTAVNNPKSLTVEQFNRLCTISHILG